MTGDSKRGQVLFAGLLLIFVLFIVAGSFKYDPKARLIPLCVGLGTLVLIALALIDAVRPLAFLKKLNLDPTEAYRSKEPFSGTKSGSSGTKLGVLMIWLSGFFILIFFFGFNLGIPLFASAFLKREAGVSWGKSLMTAGLIWGAIFVVFELAMKFSLFKGWIFGAVLPPL